MSEVRPDRLLAVRRRLVFVSFFGTVAIGQSVASAGDRTLAVLPLEKGAGEAAYDGLGTALAGMLVTDLSGLPGIQLVERARLDAVLAELRLAKSGFLDAKTAQRLGRGLGAELVVTGSYSVVGKTFLMDTRLVAVESGAVLAATHGDGVLADFVAVEKDVVEKLLAGMAVRLSLGARRRLMLETPTEDLEALASYGRGVEAQAAGDEEAARQAFRAAMAEDPEFALAARALAELKARVETAQAKERQSFKDSRERSLHGALAQLPAELERGPTFVDTPASEIDFTIRISLLRVSKQYCQAYREARHYLERRRGVWRWWIGDLDGDEPMARWRIAERLYDARGAELGLTGKGSWYGTRRGEVIHAAGSFSTSAADLLVSKTTSPEKFKSCMAYLLERCFPPEGQQAEWRSLIAAVRRFGIGDASLYQIHGRGPSPITLLDTMRLHEALLRARFSGVDEEVMRITESVLARFPAGKTDRSRILSRIEEIVRAGEAFERRQATRHGLSEEALLGLGRAVADSSPEVLRTDLPLCAALLRGPQRMAEHALASLAEEPEDRRPDRIDDLGEAAVPVILAGCLRASEAPATLEAIAKRVRAGLGRRHPGTLTDEKCEAAIADLQKRTAPETVTGMRGKEAWLLGAEAWQLVFGLHSLQARRCLVP